MSSPPRVALVGEIGVGNIGNDVSAVTVGRLLEDLVPGVEVALVARAPEGAPRSGWPVVPLTSGRSGRGPARRVTAKLRDARHLIGLVRSFDVVLVPGTGMLEAPRQRGPGGVITWLLLLGIACRIRGIPLIWFAVGGSRYAHRVPARAAAAAGRLAARRSFRDPVTRAALSAAGLRTIDDSVVPDVVFARIVEPRPGSDAVVVVNAIDWAGAGAGSEYTREFADLVTRLVASGRAVRFVIADDADREPTRSIAELLPDAPDIVERRDFDRVLESVAGADLVIASRFHVLVAALLMRRPVLALSHAVKDDELMRWAGLADLIIPIDHMTADRVVTVAMEILGDPEPTRRRLADAVEEAPSRIIAELSDALSAVGVPVPGSGRR